MNLQEVSGGKKFLELLLEAVNFTGLPPDKENPDGRRSTKRTTFPDSEVNSYFSKIILIKTTVIIEVHVQYGKVENILANALKYLCSEASVPESGITVSPLDRLRVKISRAAFVLKMKVDNNLLEENLLIFIKIIVSVKLTFKKPKIFNIEYHYIWVPNNAGTFLYKYTASLFMYRWIKRQPIHLYYFEFIVPSCEFFGPHG